MGGPGKRALSARELDAALGYIATHPEIWEVILTGGDPLVLSARRLRAGLPRRAAAGAGHPPHRGDRACEDHPPAHAPACGLAREHHASVGARAQGVRRDDL